jgi:hypothetical protein
VLSCPRDMELETAIVHGLDRPATSVPAAGEERDAND